MTKYHLDLLDHEVHGRLRVSGNGDTILYRISKSKLKKSLDISELRQSGLYILLGRDTLTQKNALYIGQGNKRQSGSGVLTRVQEHNNRADNFDWHTVLIVVSKDDRLQATELAYLENYLYQVFAQTQSIIIKNRVVPFKGELSLDQQVILSEYGQEMLSKIQVADYSNHFVSTDYLVEQLEFELQQMNLEIEEILLTM